MQTVSAERVSFDVALPPRGSIFVLVLRGAWPDRSSRPDAAPAPTSRRALAGPWHVTFDGPDAPPPRDVAELRSWTEWPDARCFSGRATVSTSFDVDAPLPSRATLELPEVRDVAEIHVNGARAAILFTPPFECDVAPLLRAGRNRLEITVANLPLNRFLALPDADLAPLRAVYGNRFPAPEEKRLVKEPMPSGLIGTVELEITETSR